MVAIYLKGPLQFLSISSLIHFVFVSVAWRGSVQVYNVLREFIPGWWEKNYKIWLSIYYLTYAQVDGPVHQVKCAKHYGEDHPAERRNKFHSVDDITKYFKVFQANQNGCKLTLNICQCRLLACPVCGSGVPEVEHEESGAAGGLLLLPSPACTPGAGSPGEGEGWGAGGVGVRAVRHWRCKSACSTCGTLRRPAQKKVPSNFIQINRDMSIYYEITETLLKISVKEALELVVSTKFGMLSRSVTISHVLRSNILSPLPHLSPNIDGNVVRSLSSEAQK